MSVVPKIMKTKFVGLLRGLLQRFDENEASAADMPRPVAAATLPTDTPHTAAQQQLQTRPVVAPPPAPVANPAADELELPLQTVLAALPMDLRSKLMQTPPAGATMVIGIEKVISQLAHGSVKISFGELRLAAPSLFANSGGENDSRPVALPLNEILARLNPALLARRNSQKKVEVGEDIIGPFDNQGEGITFTTAPLKPAPAPAPVPPPKARSILPPSWPAVPPNPILPRPAFASRNVAPVTPIPPRPAPAAFAPRNGIPRPNSISTPPPISAAPLASATPITPAARPAAPQAVTPEHAQATISAPLGALAEEWPEALRQEISQMNLANAEVALPVHLVEPALKRGRVIFSWRYVRSWIRPVPTGVSIHDGIELELPLKVIAPLFFGHQKSGGRLQRRTAISPEIPDLFFGFPQPQPEPEPAAPQPAAIAPGPPAIVPEPEAPAAPEPEVTAAPEPEVAGPEPEPARYTPRPVAARTADTNYYIWGDNGEVPRIDTSELKRSGVTPPTDFTSRRAMPKEVVARAAGLPGVAGALVALQDGLKVASQVPAELNADTLAAFLPQIFDRLGQSTRELRMGALNNVNFTVGNVPWKIYRVHSVYFAAFGRAGEALPTAQLALLAAELERK